MLDKALRRLVVNDMAAFRSEGLSEPEALEAACQKYQDRFTQAEWDDFVVKRTYIINECSRLMDSMIEEGYSTEEAARRSLERMKELQRQYYLE